MAPDVWMMDSIEEVIEDNTKNKDFDEVCKQRDDCLQERDVFKNEVTSLQEELQRIEKRADELQQANESLGRMIDTLRIENGLMKELLRPPAYTIQPTASPISISWNHQ